MWRGARLDSRSQVCGHLFFWFYSLIPFKQATPEFVAPEWKLATHLQCILTLLIVSLFNLFPNISLLFFSHICTHNLVSSMLSKEDLLVQTFCSLLLIYLIFLENKGRQKTMDNKDNISTVLSSISDQLQHCIS